MKLPPYCVKLLYTNCTILCFFADPVLKMIKSMQKLEHCAEMYQHTVQYTVQCTVHSTA